MAVFQLGEVPDHILEHIGDFNGHTVNLAGHHGVVSYGPEATIAQAGERHDFSAGEFLITYQDAPVHGHLDIMLTNFQAYGWCVKTFQEHQWQPVVVHTTGIAAIQYTIPDVVYLFWHCVQFITVIFCC